VTFSVVVIRDRPGRDSPAKPHQFGAGGATLAEDFDVAGALELLTGRSNSAGASSTRGGGYMIIIESEGITENVKVWRTDVPARVIGALGLAPLMCEAADPDVFAWYI